MADSRNNRARVQEQAGRAKHERFNGMSVQELRTHIKETQYNNPREEGTAVLARRVAAEINANPEASAEEVQRILQDHLDFFNDFARTPNEGGYCAAAYDKQISKDKYVVEAKFRNDLMKRFLEKVEERVKSQDSKDLLADSLQTVRQSTHEVIANAKTITTNAIKGWSPEAQILAQAEHGWRPEPETLANAENPTASRSQVIRENMSHRAHDILEKMSHIPKGVIEMLDHLREKMHMNPQEPSPPLTSGEKLISADPERNIQAADQAPSQPDHLLGEQPAAEGKTVDLLTLPRKPEDEGPKTPGMGG